MDKLSKHVPCKHMFSNGTEYEYFLETQCERCKRFRNGRCRIYNAIENARWVGEKAFPFNDLLDWESGYAGKTCKSFTTEPLHRTIKPRKEPEGQTELEGVN